MQLKEHRHADPAVSVKVRWDDDGVSRLVGGVRVRLEPLGRHPLEGVTTADAPLLFEGLQAELHRVVLTAPGTAPLVRTFDLPPDRRMSVKVRLAEHDRDRRGGTANTPACAS